jgi:hypothetical protein
MIHDSLFVFETFFFFFALGYFVSGCWAAEQGRKQIRN